MTVTKPERPRGSFSLTRRLIRTFIAGESAAVGAAFVAVLLAAGLALLEPWRAQFGARVPAAVGA